MKKNLILLVFVLQSLGAFGQCASDTLTSGPDYYATANPLHTLCPISCNVNQERIYQFPQNWGGLLTISNKQSNFTQINIRLVADCRWVLVDTCTLVSDISTLSYTHLGALPTSSQLFLSWNIADTDSMVVHIKTDPTQANYPRDTVNDLDTCGGVLLPIIGGQGIKAARYFDAVTLEQVLERLPNRAYLVR